MCKQSSCMSDRGFGTHYIPTIAIQLSNCRILPDIFSSVMLETCQKVVGLLCIIR